MAADIHDGKAVHGHAAIALGPTAGKYDVTSWKLRVKKHFLSLLLN